jgi:hypothetical protein
MKTRIITVVLAILTVIYAVLAHKYDLPKMPVAAMIVILFVLSHFGNDDNDIEPDMHTS